MLPGCACALRPRACALLPARLRTRPVAAARGAVRTRAWPERGKGRGRREGSVAAAAVMAFAPAGPEASFFDALERHRAALLAAEKRGAGESPAGAARARPASRYSLKDGGEARARRRLRRASHARARQPPPTPASLPQCSTPTLN